MRKENNLTEGFSLFEVLVAVVVLGISLVTVLQLFSGALNAGGTAENYTRAIMHARSKMEEILLYDRLQEKEIGGEFDDGYTWQANVQWLPPNSDRGGMTAQSDLHLFEVSVKVGWMMGNKTKNVELKTLTIATGLDENT